MKKSLIPFFAFLILFLLTIPYPFGSATSVVPGWHTTILPPYFIWGIVVMIALLLVTIGYWFLSRKNAGTNWAVFAIHFILTVAAVIFLSFPFLLLEVIFGNENEMGGAVALKTRSIIILWVLFIIGQLLFFIYYIRANRKKTDHAAKIG